MIWDILASVSMVLVLATGLICLALLLLEVLSRLGARLLIWRKLWGIFIDMAFGRCPYCGQRYGKRKEVPK